MYTLYFIPGACSLATQAILNELNQESTLVHKLEADHFETLNPAGTVPVLVDGDMVLNEGVAIILHLLNKHKNNLIAESGDARHQAIENMLFANATMHPAYGRLFFAQANVNDAAARQQVFDSAAVAINRLWQVVEAKLERVLPLGRLLPRGYRTRPAQPADGGCRIEARQHATCPAAGRGIQRGSRGINGHRKTPVGNHGE